MAAIDFPASPTVGQIFAAGNGVTYQWNGTIWIAIGATQALYVGDTPPALPGPNQLWWNSVLGQLFLWYNDGNSTQWVPAAPAPAATVVPGVPTLQLYNEQVLQATAAQIVVTMPPTPRLVRLEWGAQSAGAANDTFLLQAMVSGTPYVGANYETQQLLGSGTTPVSQLSTGQTGFLMSGGLIASGWWETSWLASPIALGNFGTGQTMETQTGGGRVVRQLGTYFNTLSPASNAITGWRLSAANSFIAGSYLRCLVLQ